MNTSRRHFLQHLGTLAAVTLWPATITAQNASNQLGQYRSHVIIGDIWGYQYGPLQFVLSSDGYYHWGPSFRVAGVCYDNVRLRRGEHVLFPVLNTLTIRYTNGVAVYTCFNLRTHELVRWRDPVCLFTELRNPNGRWRLQSFTVEH